MSSEPTVINLDNTNSMQILIQYIELAQQKGAFLLQEAELLKRAQDFITNNVPDSDINESNAKNLIIQGIHKGQRHGAYTLNDAALLSKVVQFVTNNQNQNIPQITKPTNTNTNTNTDDDLSDLAEPIPLMPKEV